jgi:integrase/recombinase XerD
MKVSQTGKEAKEGRRRKEKEGKELPQILELKKAQVQEIHKDSHRLELALNLVRRKKKEGLQEEDSKSILNFIDDLSAEGIGDLRLAKYALTLSVLSSMCKEKPLSQLNGREEVQELVKKIERNSRWSDWTKHDYKVSLKRYFQWLKKCERGTYPPEVSWIKTGLSGGGGSMSRIKKLPEELLTPEEVEKIAQAATNPRDKAFVQVLYESGCRIGELLSLSIKHTSVDEYGCILIVKGKTGMRRVRIISSAPSLTQWLENHPQRDNPEAPLWIGLWTKNMGQKLDYSAVRVQLKKLALKAGIKKSIHPHLFRHSRASFLANVMTESQMKEFFGWTQSSDMAATYVHLSGRDLDNVLLKASGLALPENEHGEARTSKGFKVRLCPRCKERNSPAQIFCGRCGSPLTLKTFMEMQKLEQLEKGGSDRATSSKERRLILEQGEVLSRVLKDPEVQNVLARKISELGFAIPPERNTIGESD